MNRSRLMLTFVSALIVALAASYFVYRQLVSAAATAQAKGEPVVAAARDLSIGSKLSEIDVKLVYWTTGSPPAGVIPDVSAALGRALIYPLTEGELVLESKLARVGSGAGLASVIAEGMRAVSIRVDEVVAVAGFVTAGTHVDVLLTGKPGTGTARAAAETLTQTILEDAQVLAAGQEIQPDAEGKPKRVNVVTLLCTPEDAAKVVLAAGEGRIQLVLRNPTDQQELENLAMVKRADLYQNVLPAKKFTRPRAKPAPPRVVYVEPPAPTTAPVELIRGGSVSKVEVPLGATP